MRGKVTPDIFYHIVGSTILFLSYKKIIFCLKIILLSLQNNFQYFFSLYQLIEFNSQNILLAQHFGYPNKIL